jgi:chromosome segregation ATPase
MTEKQRISQIEEHLSDYMQKQDFMYEEVLILKGNLGRLTKNIFSFTQSHRITSGNVEFLLEKVNRIEDSQVEMKADIGTLKTKVSNLESDVAILKSDVAILKSDVAEIKSDMSDVKNTLGLILQKLDK